MKNPLSFISTLFMNKVSNYSEEYYIYNHLRHLKSPYGIFIELYYKYLAQVCMAKIVNLKHGQKVLDVGCGVGTLVKQFNELGFDAIGVDVYEPAIKNALMPHKCKLVETSAKLPFPDHYFDLVVSREVIEHIPESEIDACIKEWKRVSKGVMIHTIAVTERGISATEDPQHVNVQTEKWWIQKFNEYNIKTTLNPTRLYFSPFGSTGYMLLQEL